LNRAERSFNDALDKLKKAAPSERALTLNNLGNVYMQKENLSKALEYYQKSLEIKTSTGDQFGAANTYSNFGTVYQRMAQETSGKKQVEQRQRAVDYYTRSLEAYRTFGARSNQGKLLFKLAFLYFQAGDKAKAREYLPDALDIFRELEMPDLENASKLEKQLG
jgi:tetratricopeptide (TPR) repeat protein